MGSTGPVGASWDAEYRRGRYAGEPPIAFVETILTMLRAETPLWEGRGLYIGCGNGRNYLPLVDAGATLEGIDLSMEALTQLLQRRPDVARWLRSGDFRGPHLMRRRFDYLIAIQVFQHGDGNALSAAFAQAATLLQPGGLLFVRINSVATQIYHRHTVVERDRLGGLTIRYDDGPKAGLLIHFASREDLLARAGAVFEVVREPQEVVMQRDAPKTGTWAQWEAVWRRRVPVDDQPAVSAGVAG
jgi:SAM-dependent methyltransferase